MKSFESDIHRLAQKTRLKTSERDALHERIVSYMEYHPIRTGALDLRKPTPSLFAFFNTGTPTYVHLNFNSMWTKVASGALAFVLVVGIPLLAERSVPGDVLYLVKTGVNESIQTQLATSPYEKVALETRLIERRIAEARLLASEGKLTGEVEAEIAKTVQGHADAVQTGLAEIRTSDADGAALAEITFSSALEVQSVVLDQSEQTGSSSIASILNVVNTVRDEVAADENPTAPSYEGLSARIEAETTRAYELFASIKGSATEEEIVDIERRLSDIDRIILDAKVLKETDETGAVADMVAVLGLIQKLISFMTDIDVRETVALETLVPITLTLEERVAYVETIMIDTETALHSITEKVESILDEGIKEKVLVGLEKVTELRTGVRDALTKSDIEAAEALSAEARALADDLTKLTLSIEALEKETEEPLPVEGEDVPEDASTTPVVIEETDESELLVE